MDLTPGPEPMCGEAGTYWLKGSDEPHYTAPCELPAIHDEPHDWAQHESAIHDGAYRAGREDAARDIERPSSILCDCDRSDSPPTKPSDRSVRLDHHCDCQAVEAAATMLGAYSKTAHAQQCDHGTEFDEFYQVNQPRTVKEAETGDTESSPEVERADG